MFEFKKVDEEEYRKALLKSFELLGKMIRGEVDFNVEVDDNWYDPIGKHEQVVDSCK